MKLLVYEWNGFGYPDLKETLRRMGHRVERIGYVVRDKCQDSYFEEKLAERLKQGFDALLSYNFYPSAAQCCQEAGIPYISWIYDGEDFGLYCPATGFDTSYIFCCDSAMAEWLKGRGPCGVYAARRQRKAARRHPAYGGGARTVQGGGLFYRKPVSE